MLSPKNEELIELLHEIIHDVIDKFTELYAEYLDKDFDGAVSHYYSFRDHVILIMNSYGMDILADSVRVIEEFSTLKAIIFLDPKRGEVFYIHAKQYVDKEKISFLIPLIMNSAKLLYLNNLKDDPRWIHLSTVRSEILVVNPRSKVLIVQQHQLVNNFEEEYLSLGFFNNKEKFAKKPKKLVEKFESLRWNPNIKQIYLVDNLGKILYSNITDTTFDCSEYIPETISFLTSSKKICEEIYNRNLYNASIGGEKLVTVCMNLNLFTLIIIGFSQDLRNFSIIQNLCLEIYKNLL